MSNSNKHIEEFLDYYLNKEQSPDYAVLITGCWGSGKTYFIRQYLGDEKKEIKDFLTDCTKYTVIYVSLFGAKTREEMDKRVLEKLHPILNSAVFKAMPRAVSLVSKIVAGVNTNPVIAIAGEEVSLFADSFFNAKGKSLKKAVVVFDDVERADMPLPELLGYLNEYVEHLHVPCILLADKEKWEEAQKCQEDKSTLHHLSSTKEKVIGKEFQIQTTFEEVWNFWSEPGHQPIGDRAWNLIKDFGPNIQPILEVVGTNNYRALKHSLSDFQHFIENIEDGLLSNREFNRLLVADFFSHQYAYYMGWFTASDIGQSNEMQRAFAEGTRGNDENKAEALKKYPLLPYERFEKSFRKIDILSNIYTIENYSKKWIDVWKDWFSLNYIKPERLNSLIKESIWFDSKDDYYLNEMYTWFILDDDSGQKAMAAFEAGLRKKKFTSPISIMCQCCKLYWYAKHGVFVEDYDAFCKKIEDYVVSAKDVLHYENVDDWKHHTMLDSTYDEIKDGLDRLQETLKKVLSEKAVSYQQNQKEDFLRRLGNKKSAISEHACESIANEYLNDELFDFGSLNAEEFCEAYRNIPTQVKRKCFVALGSRYKYHPEQLEKERVFLEALLNASQEIYDRAERPLVPSVFAFYYLIRTLKEILGVKNDVA